MKRVTLLSIITAFVVQLQAQEKFEIKGEFKDPRFEGKEIILYAGQDRFSSKVTNGKFRLTGEVDQPKYASILLEQQAEIIEAASTNDLSKVILPGSTSFFIQEGKISMKGNSFGDLAIKGTPLNDAYASFNKKMAKAIKEQGLTSPTDIKNFQEEYSLAYAEKNPSTMMNIPLFLKINNTFFLSQNMDRVSNMYANLAPEIQNLNYAKGLLHSIDQIKSFGVGTTAPQFSIQSNKGNTITLDQYKGKYVLLEFWAHYCKPCIKEIPHLEEAYEEFNDKGFTILQVSLDQEKHVEQWHKAVEQYSSKWDNAIDNFDRREKVSTLYHVFGIPDNFLINPEGKIVAVDLKGDNLKYTLKKLLN